MREIDLWTEHQHVLLDAAVVDNRDGARSSLRKSSYSPYFARGRGRRQARCSISYTSGVTNAVIVRPRVAAFSGKGRKIRTPIRIDELLKRFGSQDFDAVPPHVKVPTHLEMARRREANDQ